MRNSKMKLDNTITIEECISAYLQGNEVIVHSGHVSIEERRCDCDKN